MNPFFVRAQTGYRFCVHHPAQQGTARGAIVYLHPFAEEMNKSRRMASLQAREMARLGFEVLQIDLFGCGDSSGDFGDVTWNDWVADVQLACRWLRSRTEAPLTLWGLRVGCLLATAAAVILEEEVNFIFWQPVVSGKQHWQQFVRLKIASELSSGGGKEVVSQLRQQLAMGESVEIAGYTVGPRLADGLERAELNIPANFRGQLAWFELSMREGSPLSPVARRCAAEIEANQVGRVEMRSIYGPAFWQTVEIENAPLLIDATTGLLEFMP